MAASTAFSFFLLVLALLSLSQGPALCTARRHDCLRVDFKPPAGNSSASASAPRMPQAAPASWRTGSPRPKGGRDVDAVRMPFCGGSFWVSLNTTQLLEDVACRAPAPAPAPAGHGHGRRSSHHGGGGGKRKVEGVCTSGWKGDGYEVVVRDSEDAAAALEKRACSSWVEAPTRTSRRERVLVCARCPADEKKMSPGRRGLLRLDVSITITIVIKF